MARPDQASARGARRSAGQWLETWSEWHAQALVSSLGKLLRQPLGSALTIIVIGLGLALPGALHLVLLNAEQVTENIGRSVQLSVFLTPGTEASQAKALHQRIEGRDDVLEAKLVSPEEGLEDFRSVEGFSEALSALEDNPLPWAITLRPSHGLDSPELTEALAMELRGWDLVDIVQVDTDWVRRLASMLDLLRRAIEGAALVLGIGVIAVAGNTIRLDINARREEIEVVKLVGGSDAYVRRPFLYGGFWYGLGGGLLAWLLLWVGSWTLAGPVEVLATDYGSAFRLLGPDSLAATATLLGGPLLGWLGAWWSSSYHLRQIEPKP
ncbi:MAG: permease-like cell division protein FtsX [Steroidobacteraceae bacterium]